jgi:NADPH:quinone reductase-like Zn-dependent oxidoreductase
MPTIRSIVVDPYSESRFVIRDVEVPEQKPDQALVRVEAFSLNLGEIRKAYTTTESIRLGWDLAGTVVRSAGDGSGLCEGTKVVGFVNGGSWAEVIAVPTNNLAFIPDIVSIAQAATLPTAGITALRAIERGSGLLGRKVLVTGASGGVGLFACQLARLSGAQVIGLIRNNSYKVLVEATGVSAAIVSMDAVDVRPYAPFRLIVDAVGGNVLSQSMKMLAPDGVCIALADSEGANITFDLWSFAWAGRASLYGLVIFNEFERESASASLERLVYLVSTGQLCPHISIEASWTEISDVTNQIWQRRVPGKAVMHINS